VGHPADANDPAPDPRPPHAVARLRDACLATSETLPRLDRGGPRKERCPACRLAPSHCMCALRASVPTRAGVCLVMSEFEPLKPSNTGWLVADVVPDTQAFAWSRLYVDPALLALLDDPQWQPMVVFPGEFASPSRVVVEVPAAPRRRPLFILLDGTWSESRKAFRKSPYLDRFPVLSLTPGRVSRYELRRSWHEHHFCTAEIAALCLASAGDAHAAQVLEATLDVFSDRYLRAKQSLPPNPAGEAQTRLEALRMHTPTAQPDA
jgi:DTW domain-containing protein YfiP